MSRRFLRLLILVVSTIFVIYLAAWTLLTQPGWPEVELPELPPASAERLRAHVERLSVDLVPRNFRHPEQLDRAARYIAVALEATGARVSEQVYVAESREYRNVIARLGPEEGPLIVVGAHYDAFGELPGADDNASGIAGLLELARLLAGLPLRARVELVAYSTEEPPFFGSEHMGSAHHAALVRTSGDEPRAVVVLEMIGYFSERQPSPLPLLGWLYPRRGNFVLIAGRWQDRALIADVKRGFRSASKLPVTSYCGPSAIGTDLSDHRSYWAEGYSAVMVTDTAFIRNRNYHTAGDRAETLDYESMARVVEGVVGVVLALSD